MGRTPGRSRSISIVLAASLVVLAAVAAGGADRLIGTVFKDDLPKVSAVERAIERGRTRGGRTVVRLLAIRVEFQPDNDPRSTGDGTFDHSEWDGQTFDGTPHDKEYFELHMTALNNYYSSVSYGQLEIEFDVVPADSGSAYVLPHQMGWYKEYSEDPWWYVYQVENFVRDAFAAADTTDTIQFCDYDGYILFHAGADWQSDVFGDSPFDLPSAHISLGDSISVNDGTCAVWESAIMPETSSQDGLQIVLNGTLVHEVGHTLGLPDLYNTSNFFPSVGYWSIMDSGGRIGMNTPWGYAYGLIPAAPCAWSKEYMGWIDPTVVLEGPVDLELRASVLRGGGEQLYKIPLTSDEYFLIENRLDDLGGDNTVVIEQERGVVLGPVDPECTDEICPVNNEYDFLLPGPGMVIYHIDDTRVIPGLMPYDTVNFDQDRRGVAIEEADGIMDLGDITSFYWAGSAYDPFFAAYDDFGVPTHNNTFSWDTYPSTDNNLGGKTYVSVTEISDADSVMTLRVSFDRWKDGWPIDIGERIGPLSPRVADLDGDGEGEIVVAATSGNVYAWHADGTPVIGPPAAPGYFATAAGGAFYSPAVADIDGDGDSEVIVAGEGGKLYVWNHEDLDGDGVADLYSSNYPVSLGGPATAPPLAADLDATPGLEIAAAAGSGDLTVVDRTGGQIAGSPYSFGHLVLDDVTLAAGDLDGDGFSEIVMSTTNRGWVVALNADGSSLGGWPVSVAAWVDETVGVLVGDLDRAGDGAPEVVAVGSDGVVHVWDSAGRELPGWPVTLDGEVEARAALGDVDGEGYLEIVVPVGGTKVLGLRMNGTNVENWPLTLDPGDSLSTTGCPPLVGDIDDDGQFDVLVGGPGGNVFAWGGEDGDRLPGWPLSSDPSLGAPWVGDIEGDGETDLLVAGDEGRVLFYRLPYETRKAGNFVWPTEAGAASGVGAFPDSLLSPEPVPTDGLLSSSRTYCYPNPATRSDLTVRVFLDEPADIDVEIYDVTGQRVAHLVSDGIQSVNEIVWDTSRVASGLYVVRVEASVPDPASSTTMREGRRREEKIMKVAVIR